jgi:hypothetical protein
MIVSLTATENSLAQVQYGGLEIPNREFAQTSELQDVRLRVTANYQFDAAQVPDRWICELAVENEVIAEDRMAPTDAQASGSVELEGSVVETSQFNIQQFRVDESETTVQIPTELRFRIEAGEQEIASAQAQATPELTVTPANIEGESSVGGSGEIVLSR